jgi:hypothetical protein
LKGGDGQRGVEALLPNVVHQLFHVGVRRCWVCYRLRAQKYGKFAARQSFSLGD